MGYVSGEIYFVRERTKEDFSPFVKIGLVHGIRDSLERLKEHQTGNPRPLFIDEAQVVKTEAVDLVEAQMHKFFAPRRVSGEWFEFPNNEELAQAVSKARELSREASSMMPILQAAEELSKKTSSEGKIPATQESLDLSVAIAQAGGRVAVCKDLEKVIKSKLAQAMEADEGNVKDTIEMMTKTYKAKFNEKEFLKDHAELYAKYVELVQKWKKPDFRMAAKASLRDALDEDFLSQIVEIESMINSVDSLEHAYRLIEPQLLLTKLKARSEWDLETSKAKLKVLCGEASGIEGVCTWIRKFEEKPVFNEPLFVEENPEMYFDYLTDPKTGVYLRVVKRKA
jgi:hypothetical protein